jgi:hypothetical protein
MTGLLHGRAIDRTVGAKDTGVGGHDLGVRCAALRTGQDTLKNNLRMQGPHLLVE